MKKLSQRDPRWKNKTLGNSRSTIGNYGCFLTCLAMMADIDPIEANKKIKKGDGFSKDLIKSPQAAKALGLKYSGKYAPDKIPFLSIDFPCIAEVDMSPSPGKQQHFVVVISKEKIIDPWTGTEKSAKKYPIVSCRLFRSPGIPVKEKTTENPGKTYNVTSTNDSIDVVYNNKKVEMLEARLDVVNAEKEELEQITFDTAKESEKLKLENKLLEEKLTNNSNKEMNKFLKAIDGKKTITGSITWVLGYFGIAELFSEADIACTVDSIIEGIGQITFVIGMVHKGYKYYKKK